MAAHCTFPPEPAEPFVRGDPAVIPVRFRVEGVDQDITTYTWRVFVRTRLDADLVSECGDFEVVTPDTLPQFYPDGGSVPSVLLARFSGEQTRAWANGYVADVEQLTPDKHTWVIIDALRVDRDVSYTEALP